MQTPLEVNHIHVAQFWGLQSKEMPFNIAPYSNSNINNTAREQHHVTGLDD